ncbi:MAG: hypothetical protein KGJ00_10075 [Bradyrhizobium sp.]|nr:hypothetical protein [Bradyrhizobium sp.]
MLPAIGAASIAFDAIQSLTSPSQPSSQPTGPGGFSLDGSSDVSRAVSGTASGFSSAHISSGSFNALLDAQSSDSGNVGSTVAFGSSASSQSQAVSPSGTASSTYNAVNQLVQSTAVPLGFSPISMSV